MCFNGGAPEAGSPGAITPRVKRLALLLTLLLLVVGVILFVSRGGRSTVRGFAESTAPATAPAPELDRPPLEAAESLATSVPVAAEEARVAVATPAPTVAV